VYFFDHPFHSLRLYYLVRVPADAPLRPDPREVSELAWLDPEALAEGEVAESDRAVLRLAVSASARADRECAEQGPAGRTQRDRVD